MVAALRLARAGVPVLVLEAGAALAADSKASTFHPPSLELLDTLGLTEVMHQRGLRAPVFQQRDRQDGILAELDLTLLADETPFPYRLQLEQNKLTAIVLPLLLGTGNATVRFDARVDRVEDGGDHARVILGPAGVAIADADVIEADWLIGADGANSMVRQSLGFGFEGVTFPERFLVMSTSHEFRDDLPDLAHVAYLSDAAEWLVLLRTPDHWRVLMPVSPQEPDADAATPERIQQRLESVVPIDGDYQVLAQSLYKVHQRVASTFSQHRVLLAGDSAHMNNPLGGLGMNSGLHDAWSAVDTVLAVLAGADADKASHLYGTVRAETCHEYVQAETTKNFQDMQERDATARAARAEQFRALAADPEATKAYLRRTSMLTSAHAAIERVQRELAAL
jgi:2-polyprenyl-6-methoxyphenol hydroxylase-like FAD-dependent oxidoreductase